MLGADIRLTCDVYLLIPLTFGIRHRLLELEPLSPKLSRLPFRLRCEFQRCVQPEDRSRCPPTGGSNAADHGRQRFLESVRTACLWAKPRTVCERAGIYESIVTSRAGSDPAVDASYRGDGPSDRFYRHKVSFPVCVRCGGHTESFRERARGETDCVWERAQRGRCSCMGKDTPDSSKSMPLRNPRNGSGAICKYPGQDTGGHLT